MRAAAEVADMYIPTMLSGGIPNVKTVAGLPAD